jgi:hypothetical protein
MERPALPECSPAAGGGDDSSRAVSGDFLQLVNKSRKLIDVVCDECYAPATTVPTKFRIYCLQYRIIIQSAEFVGNSFTGGGNFAFERPRMLVGDPTARMIYFHSTDGGLLPSDFDGSLLPPTGSPNFFFEWFDTSNLAEYKFQVDWTTGTGTFTGPLLIPVAAFNFPTCGNARERCVPRPGTAAQLEVIGDRLMYRVASRNFGSYESIVLNHTVNATGGSPGVAAPRWYELRDPGNVLGATVFQQGTYYPGDGIFHWMGSIAPDRNGDITLGYSAANSTLFPSIRYAGRLPTDPPGTLGQGEATLQPK